MSLTGPFDSEECGSNIHVGNCHESCRLYGRPKVRGNAACYHIAHPIPCKQWSIENPVTCSRSHGFYLELVVQDLITLSLTTQNLEVAVAECAHTLKTY